jgi:acetyl-CoA C-acetyltransferase
VNLDPVVIVGAKRTAIGSLGGALSPLQAHEFSARIIDAAMAQAEVSGDEVSETILGQVLSAGVGMNPARQAARAAGITDLAPAMTINQVCGSGLRAVALAAQQIQTQSAEIVVAGGQESMSNAPHLAVLRKGKKLGDMALVDSVMRDGLSDAFFGYPMGNTAENIAEMHDISREQQDEFALLSQQKASAADREGRFIDEISPITIAGRKGDVIVARDEYIRYDASLESLASLRPVFAKDGTVTAGNASGINDGAAALVLMSAKQSTRRGIEPLATIASFAHTGLDPAIMGLGPISASKKALEKAGWNIADVDLWEINEAFAAQSLAVISELEIDPARVNVNGGAIALGHPIGASGARILVTLIYEMARRDSKRGLATLCIGGGMGIAMCIHRSWGG